MTREKNVTMRIGAKIYGPEYEYIKNIKRAQIF